MEPYDGLPQSDLFEYVVQKGVLNPHQAMQLLYQTASAIKYLILTRT